MLVTAPGLSSIVAPRRRASDVEPEARPDMADGVADLREHLTANG
jgi:hypothetical protein